jgi:hypothetical protein
MYTLKATALIAALGLLIATTPVIAMTGLEFLQAGDDANAKAVIMEPIVIKFISQGYRHVPDWAHLAQFTRELILEKGYRDRDIVEIAEEAAITHGMTK